MNSDIVKEIFWLCLNIMKKILDILEFKFGKNSDEFKYMKKEVMDYFYNNLHKFYENLLKKDILARCNCGAKIRHGFNKCPKCGGCGYKVK